MLTAYKPSGADKADGGTYTIRMGYVTKQDAPGVMLVDIENVPGIADLSNVASEDDITPTCGDVLVYEQHPEALATERGRWRPSGLWTEVELDFGSGNYIDHKVFLIGPDIRVKEFGSIISMVPSARPYEGEGGLGERQEDEAEFDAFVCSCLPFWDPDYDWGDDSYGAGYVRAYIHSLRGAVVGKYRFNYSVSNSAGWNCHIAGSGA
jgi:hypothetical protein